eukprot:TRINITY_DN3551_c0_g1_i1.p1 TRINITY_DN3551_c0_g1~~TRINITY_DN3551_c0_g1_i1.p1  ORF type:complete len:422 (-),score=92.73 TRINITY_DN3551_c0_g1_i1:111-1376(-)
MSSIRNLVSKQKRRFQKYGYDLDLSYINDRIIAMGFPSESVEAAYRNPMKEVLRFLDQFHKDHYKVYNLCSERGYEASKFYNRAEVFPFDDHNAPPFELILMFCRNVAAWLAEDEKNIAVIHCKAGKGRTGLMICAWLLFNKDWASASDSLTFYAAMRTYNKKGVTIPSQIRYVHYFDESLQLPDNKFEPKTLLLNRIVFHTIPKSGNVSDIHFTVSRYKTPIFHYKEHSEKLKKEAEIAGAKREEPRIIKRKKSSASSKKRKDTVESNHNNNHTQSPPTTTTITTTNTTTTTTTEDEADDDTEGTIAFDCGGLPICGDIRVDFTIGGKVMGFWFNTYFVKNRKLVLKKEEIDKVHKDKSHKLYDEHFRIELNFGEMNDLTASASSENGHQDLSLSSSSAIEPTTTTTTTTTTSSSSSSSE